MEPPVDTRSGARQEDQESVEEQRGKETPERPEAAPLPGTMVADSSSSRARLLFMQAQEQVRSQAAKHCGKKTALVDMVQMAAQEMKHRAVEEGDQSKDQGRAQDRDAVGEEDGQEMLTGLEALRREFKHELDLLRAEIKDYINKVTQGLESRMLSQRPSFQMQVHQGPGTAERPLQTDDQSLEGRHKSLSVPSLLPGKAPNRAATSTRPKARRTKSETFSLNSEGLSENADSKVMAARSSRTKKAAGALPHSKALVRGTAKVENPGRVK